MYNVSVGTDRFEYETRDKAITAAKEYSAESRQTVVVRDESERERLAYQGGELESYTYDTQPRRG